MTEASTSPFHVGMTPERVIDGAVQLTRESHLWGWSIRDLARHLDVTPPVVYHHVGGRDLLARRVTERATAGLAVPPSELAWQEWFRVLLRDVYPRVTSCPGTAKWLLMHGPVFPAVLPILQAGIAKLVGAGFAENASFAYAAMLNNPLMTVSTGDDRLMHEDDGPRDHHALMAEFERAGAQIPDVAPMLDQFMQPFLDGGAAARLERRRYYDYIVQSTIAGVAALQRDGQ
ncbi:MULTISPECIES: TetR/AcrR family transcriptional regulator [Streptomyces]|uniref:TetR/AcrR family transcriptional regulator n=1 Tax=Streptomyces TaxID=1883 RepID=UPI0005172C91|nr:TetR family transcriptional regulator [Streptomyces sp. CNS654]